MTLHYQSTLLVISLGGCLSILWCLRKNLLHPRHALWWSGVAIIVLLAGLFPSTFDALAHTLGVTYPPTLFLYAAVVILLLRVLLGDLERCQMMLQLRRLNQHTARLSLRVRQLEGQSAKVGAEGTQEANHD